MKTVLVFIPTDDEEFSKFGARNKQENVNKFIIFISHKHASSSITVNVPNIRCKCCNS